MEKEFVPYELAVKLKELGFNEPCFAVFNESKQSRINSESRNWNDNLKNGDTTSAPTYSQSFRWFREKRYRFNIANDSTKENSDYYYDVWYNGRMYESHYLYKTYEEAELACLDKLIELTFKSE